MSTSGTYIFDPGIGEVVLYTFGLIGIRRTEITQQHLTDARMAVNLLFAEWGNSTPNLWTVDLVTETLVTGTATYDVDPNTIMILDAYLRTSPGTDSQSDRIITPLSRTEYASMPNKDTQAPPTVFWFDRLLAPTITLWPVPDDSGPYQLRYYVARQIEDASLIGGQTAAIPQWWLPAFVWGLAAQLAVSYAPDKAVALATKADSVLKKAMDQNVENVPMVLAPQIRNFYPR